MWLLSSASKEGDRGRETHHPPTMLIMAQDGWGTLEGLESGLGVCGPAFPKPSEPDYALSSYLRDPHALPRFSECFTEALFVTLFFHWCAPAFYVSETAPCQRQTI